MPATDEVNDTEHVDETIVVASDTYNEQTGAIEEMVVVAEEHIDREVSITGESTAYENIWKTIYEVIYNRYFKGGKYFCTNIKITQMNHSSFLEMWIVTQYFCVSFSCYGIRISGIIECGVQRLFTC